MNEFSFGDRKSDPQVGTLPRDGTEEVLKIANVRLNRVRANCECEIIDVQDRKTLSNCRVEAGNVQHKEKRRNRGALGGTNRHWAEDLRGTLEDKPTLAFGEE